MRVPIGSFKSALLFSTMTLITEAPLSAGSTQGASWLTDIIEKGANNRACLPDKNKTFKGDDGSIEW